MNVIKFPKRQPDGTFCIEIAIAMSSSKVGNLAEIIQDWWSNEWTPRNRQWIRIWNRDRKQEFIETLRYDAEFMTGPEVVFCGESKLIFRLIGRGSSKYWRDWLVSRLIPDLKSQFPDVGQVISIQNCT
jgi:hypothetical protein